MLVSSIKGNGVQGNFDVVVRMRPQLDPEHLRDRLYFCAFDTGTMQWTAVRPIMVDGRTIDGVTGIQLSCSSRALPSGVPASSGLLPNLHARCGCI